MNEREVAVLVSEGQGAAALAIMRQLLWTLFKKRLLRRIEVVAVLQLAAEALERESNAAQYASAAAIRQLSKTFLDEPDDIKRH
jgi:hypothetical protein